MTQKIPSIIWTINRRIGALILLFGLYGASVHGQDGSRDPGATGDTLTSITADSLAYNNVEDMGEHSPTRAMLSSLLVPGLGQIYNKKYWKLPIVYAAMGGGAYWIYFNTTQYREWVDTYEADPNSTSERYLQLWRRQLEISYLALVGVHALQVLDAYVDAQLFYWDVNPELAIRMRPSIQQPINLSGISAPAYGLSFEFRIK